MPEVLAVGLPGGVAGEPEIECEGCEAGELAAGDDAVLQDLVQHAEVGVDVAAGASRQPVDKVGQRWPLACAAQRLLVAGYRAELALRRAGHPGGGCCAGQGVFPGAGQSPVRGAEAGEQVGGGAGVVKCAVVLGQLDAGSGAACGEAAGGQVTQVVAGELHGAHDRRRGEPYSAAAELCVKEPHVEGGVVGDQDAPGQ